MAKKKDVVTVGAPSLKPKKKHIFGKILLTLIIGICLGGVIMYYYLDIYMKDDKKSVNTSVPKNNTNSNEEKEVSLPTDSYVVKRLITGMHFVDGTNIEKALYVNERTIAKDLPGDFLDNLLLKEAYRTESNFNEEVKVKDLEQARINLFGKNYEIIIPTDKEVGSCPVFKYNTEKRSYKRDSSECNITNDISISYDVVEARIIENKSITIYEVVAFIKDDKIYKKIDGSNNVSDEVKDVTTDGFNVLDNVKKLNQYKYTFTYDKDSNNYVFNSIELVK